MEVENKEALYNVIGSWKGVANCLFDTCEEKDKEIKHLKHELEVYKRAFENISKQNFLILTMKKQGNSGLIMC